MNNQANFDVNKELEKNPNIDATEVRKWDKSF